MLHQVVKPEAVREEVGRILSSRRFAQAPRLSRLLEFIVSRALEGGTSRIKETSLGVEVFGLPPDYDPKTDPKVRVAAGRLRARLEAYYRVDGAADPIRIVIPKGCYVPLFLPRQRRTDRLIAAALGALGLLLVAVTSGR